MSVPSVNAALLHAFGQGLVPQLGSCAATSKPTGTDRTRTDTRPLSRSAQPFMLLVPYNALRNCTGPTRGAASYGLRLIKRGERNALYGTGRGGQGRIRTGFLPPCLRVCFRKHLLPGLPVFPGCQQRGCDYAAHRPAILPGDTLPCTWFPFRRAHAFRTPTAGMGCRYNPRPRGWRPAPRSDAGLFNYRGSRDRTGIMLAALLPTLPAEVKKQSRTPICTTNYRLSQQYDRALIRPAGHAQAGTAHPH